MNLRRVISGLTALALTVSLCGCRGAGRAENSEKTEFVNAVVQQSDDAKNIERKSQLPEVNDDTADSAEEHSEVMISGSTGNLLAGLIDRLIAENPLHGVPELEKSDSSEGNILESIWDFEDPDDVQSVEITEDYEDIIFLNVYNRGTTDKSVAYIQQQLMQLGFMEYAEPTEYYGSITMEAVTLFQRQNDLKQDGIMGEQSLAMLMNPEAKRYVARLGMEGSDIKRIQNRLYELGYLPAKSNINSKFDENTEKAVKSLQNANGLNADGKAGEMTIELMYSDEVRANIVSFGDNSEVVLACQKRLKELGYLTTSPDGMYGKDTLAAVKLFQSRNNLVVDGYLGPSTREILDSSAAIANGLELGAEGDTVKNVQKLLIKYGYLSSGSDSGYFGETTESAVKAFQRKNGLTADGNVGKNTMNKLTGESVVKADDKVTGKVDVSTGAASGSVKELLKVALSKLGCKYSWGAKGPDKFDCSGFVYWCLNQVGVKQSYITSYGWRTIGKYKKITDYNSMKAGDIIVVYGHVGIIGENGMVIDASSSYGKICHRKLSSWWKKNFICAWRIW